MLSGERETGNTKPYNWGRLTEEARIIRACEDMGGVNLRKLERPPAGFARETHTGCEEPRIGE